MVYEKSVAEKGADFMILYCLETREREKRHFHGNSQFKLAHGVIQSTL